MKYLSQKKGSAILPTLLIIMVIVGAGISYLSIAFNEFKMSYRNQDLQGALNLAEAGIEEAMLAMKNETWTGWTTIATDNYYQNFNDIGLGNGRTGNVQVYASVLDEESPIIFAEGKIVSSYGTVKKQLRTDLDRKGVFLNGMTAKDTVVFNGNKIAIDSYNSDDGPYNTSTNRNANGTIGSLATSAGALASGNADVFGYIATGGGAPAIGAQGIVSGDLNASAGTVDTTRIATDFIADFPDAANPDESSLPLAITTLPSSGSIGIFGTTTYYKVSSYSNSSTDNLEIVGPVVIVVTGDVTTKGELTILNDPTGATPTNGSVELYVGGDVDVGGNGIVNMSDVPKNFLLYGTAASGSSQTIKISGNGAIQSAIYAPNADLELKGSGSSGIFLGAAVANTITMTGDFEFHYDEALTSITLDNSYKISRWRELIGFDERVPIDTPTSMVSHAVSF
jgi:hypothetical protein